MTPVLSAKTVLNVRTFCLLEPLDFQLASEALTAQRLLNVPPV